MLSADLCAVICDVSAEYLRSRGLIKATTLDTLQGTTIGFDGVQVRTMRLYIRRSLCADEACLVYCHYQLFKNSEVVNEPLHVSTLRLNRSIWCY